MIRVLRGILALIVGAVAGASLEVILILGPLDAFKAATSLILGEHRLFFHPTNPAHHVTNMGAVISEITLRAAFDFSFYIAATAFPIWVMLGGFKLNRLIYAIGLGALLGAAAYAWLDWSSGQSDPGQYGVQTALSALTGAVAGVATWRVAHAKARTA